MKVKAHLLAFEEDKIRTITIPDEKYMDASDVLEAVFKFGQNDFQPQQMPSLSVGDVVELEIEGDWVARGFRHWIVLGMGWKAMTEAEYEDYKRIPMRERGMSTYKMGRTM